LHATNLDYYTRTKLFEKCGVTANKQHRSIYTTYIH